MIGFSFLPIGAIQGGNRHLRHRIGIPKEIARLRNLIMAGVTRLQEKRLIGAPLRETTKEAIGKGHLRGPSSQIVTPMGRKGQPHLR